MTLPQASPHPWGPPAMPFPTGTPGWPWWSCNYPSEMYPSSFLPNQACLLMGQWGERVEEGCESQLGFADVLMGKS